MSDVILPQEIDKSPLPGYGCLYTIGKLYSIFPLLLDNDKNIQTSGYNK